MHDINPAYLGFYTNEADELKFPEVPTGNYRWNFFKAALRLDLRNFLNLYFVSNNVTPELIQKYELLVKASAPNVQVEQKASKYHFSRGCVKNYLQDILWGLDTPTGNTNAQPKNNFYEHLVKYINRPENNSELNELMTKNFNEIKRNLPNPSGKISKHNGLNNKQASCVILSAIMIGIMIGWNLGLYQDFRAGKKTFESIKRFNKFFAETFIPAFIAAFAYVNYDEYKSVQKEQEVYKKVFDKIESYQGI